MSLNPYRVLKIKKTATANGIRAAYRRLAAAHHPDRNPGDAQARQRFERIQAAYEILSDPERRRRYDETGDTTPPRPDNSAGQVRLILVSLLDQLFSDLVQAKKDLTRENLCAYLLKAVDHRLAELARAQKELHDVHQRMTAAQGRFTVAAESNVFEEHLETILSRATAQLRSVQEDTALLQRVRAVIERTTYRQDGARVEPRSSSFVLLNEWIQGVTVS